MIPLEFSLAVALYLSLSLAALFFCWLVLEHKGQMEPIQRQEEQVWQCTICTYLYMDSQFQALSICPRCGSYNK